MDSVGCVETAGSLGGVAGTDPVEDVSRWEVAPGSKEMVPVTLILPFLVKRIARRHCRLILRVHQLLVRTAPETQGGLHHQLVFRRFLHNGMQGKAIAVRHLVVLQQPEQFHLPIGQRGQRLVISIGEYVPLFVQ